VPALAFALPAFELLLLALVFVLVFLLVFVFLEVFAPSGCPPPPGAPPLASGSVSFKGSMLRSFHWGGT
jgi:hypothetical protein